MAAASVALGPPLKARSALSPSPKSDAITAPLERRIQNGSLDDVVVDIGWPFEGRHVVYHLDGSGVGIWDRRVQFRLTPSQTRSLLVNLVQARFGALPDTIGGDPKERRRLKGKMTVSVGPATKTVSQLEGGQASESLQRLADEFLRAGSVAARQGVRVDTFRDAFQKLQAGTLAPEALLIVLRHGSAGRGAVTRTLQLEGRRATLRTGKPDAAGTSPLRLSKEEFDSLLLVLRDAGLDHWPSRLRFAEPADLRIQVLDRVSSVAAAPSTVVPQSSAAAQKAFDQVCGRLIATESRVVESSSRTEARATPSPSARR